MCENGCEEDIESLPLPEGWPKVARHALLNVVGIVRVAMLAGREFLIQNGDAPQAHIHRLETDNALLREGLRIVGSSMECIVPHRRHFVHRESRWASTPRECWPSGAPCAKPQVGIEGEPGDPIVLEIDGLEGRRHLPVICARLAA